VDVIQENSMPKTARTEAAEHHRKDDHTTALKRSEETNCHVTRAHVASAEVSSKSRK